ncbi:CopG family transcriptional regulator [Neobacillus pocheonensis]|uniref:CopG family transcriptional regulator n=1 Tax=Neobacillus pocheonensis TaxID=363869 RepID=A0ABT0WFV6_9BACI|nr:CopG family transcriptional regulator [Neobacillus pocheonensis]
MRSKNEEGSQKVPVNIRIESAMKEKLAVLWEMVGLSEADVYRMAFAELIEKRNHWLKEYEK